MTAARVARGTLTASATRLKVTECRYRQQQAVSGTHLTMKGQGLYQIGEV